MACSNRKCTSAAELRNRITIETVAETPDGMGGWTEGWTTLANVWAKVEPKTGGEFWYGHQIEEHIAYQVTIRYLSTVTSKMRIQWDGRQLQIKAVMLENGRKDFMRLKCVEGEHS